MMFYTMFVNTRGLIDSHIPADLQMEHTVNTFKKHIKHMLSNKTESNIMKKTAALGGLHAITENYDTVSNVIIRTTRHSKPSETGDEMTMIDDLLHIKPFTHVGNRYHDSFKNINGSLLAGLHYGSYLNWLKHRLSVHGSSLINK